MPKSKKKLLVKAYEEKARTEIKLYVNNMLMDVYENKLTNKRMEQYVDMFLKIGIVAGIKIIKAEMLKH